jgi:crotonobetainyl-CoA:carnitine CoA-transferase CaiB-like acyl-CoA transferase
LVESALNIAAEQVVEYTAYGNLLERMGNHTPGCLLQDVYPCAVEETWLAVSVRTEAEMAALRSVTGEDVAAWAATRTVADAVGDLIAAGVPAGEVTDFRSISTHPLFAARGFFETVDHEVVGTHPVPGQPFRLSGRDRWIRTPAPWLGQHNHEVLCGLLGLSESEFADLEARGVIGYAPVA